METPGCARATTARDTSHHRPLRRLLVVFDVIGFLAAWALVLWIPSVALGARPNGFTTSLLLQGAAVLTGITAMRAQHLYLSRVCTLRTVELARTARAALLTAGAVWITAHLTGSPISAARAILGGITASISVGFARGLYAALLRGKRARGQHLRPVLLVGDGAEAHELVQLIQTHPDLGYQLIGFVGDRNDNNPPGNLPRLGSTDEAASIVRSHSASGVLVATTDINRHQLQQLLNNLREKGTHIHLTSGLWGIDHRRLRPVPLSHEPLFYLEPVTFGPASRLTKRVVDLTLGFAALILTAPVMAAAALAIKLGDGGPILFRQTRVGRDGKPITVLKLRTMIVDAENHLDEVADANQRNGVLFKRDDDPRRTRIGRILEAASIDELPQLFCVLRGTMSLVGPRPALPAEVDQFDREHLRRLSVPPGMTGLWQVEARDNPSFHPYRRLDLFYVENWSVLLDLLILTETVSSVLYRLVILCRRNRRPAAITEPAPMGTPSGISDLTTR